MQLFYRPFIAPLEITDVLVVHLTESIVIKLQAGFIGSHIRILSHPNQLLVQTIVLQRITSWALD